MSTTTYLQQVILSSIAKGAHTLTEISRACYALYPPELQTLLDELIAQKRVRCIAKKFYLTAAQDAAAFDIPLPMHQGTYDAELPEPHPHDFDWRFDSSTAQKIATMVLKETTASTTALLLGAPSIFVELAYSSGAPRTILLDWSRALIEYLQRYHHPTAFELVHHDMFSQRLWTTKQQVDVVVTDPPWYPEHYAAFLAQATTVTRIGGRILVSLFPSTTRPEAVRERWNIFETAEKLGLHIHSLHCGALRYHTPLFEQASLDTTHIEVPKNWRSGDLAIFEKVAHPQPHIIQGIVAAATEKYKEQQEIWDEVFLGRYKVKLRGPFADTQEKPDLLSIEPYDTLPTVSRRYKGRECIDLWLWNNQVFAARGKAALLAALYVLAQRPLPEHLQQVPAKHVDIAIALLLYKTGIDDSQAQTIGKETQRESTSTHPLDEPYRRTGEL